MRRFLLPLLAALALPTAVNAGVDPEVHNLCKEVTDYIGCIQANTKSEDNSSDFSSKGEWVEVFNDKKYKMMGQKSIDLESFLLTEDKVTIYGLRSESNVDGLGKLYLKTEWEGINCNSKEKLSGTWGKIPIQNPSKMSRKEKKTSIYDINTLWKKYTYVCKQNLPKKSSWKNARDILSSDHPHQKTFYKYQLDNLGLSYKEAQEVYAKKCRQRDDYEKCMAKFGLW